MAAPFMEEKRKARMSDFGKIMRTDCVISDPMIDKIKWIALKAYAELEKPFYLF